MVGLGTGCLDHSYCKLRAHRATLKGPTLRYGRYAVLLLRAQYPMSDADNPVLHIHRILIMKLHFEIASDNSYADIYLNDEETGWYINLNQGESGFVTAQLVHEDRHGNQENEGNPFVLGRDI